MRSPRANPRKAGKEGGPRAPSGTPVEIAIRYLTPRRRFEREIRNHLKQKGFPAAEVEEALARLVELELVSDADTARAWIRDRMNFAPRGRGLLRRELLGKGVPAPIVEEALEELLPEESEEEAALAFLRNQARKWSGLAEGVARRRMWSALARRGFSPPACREALSRFAEEQEFPAEDTSWD